MRVGATLNLLLGLLLASSGHAQNAQPSEYQVKAAFIFNFAKSPLCIGILGENPFGADLERTVQNKTLNNRPIVVKECRTLEEAKKCHLLFISAPKKEPLQEILNGLVGTKILTIGETETFIKSGGMINFFREGTRFRFEINDEAAKKAGLKIDSKLLGLGKKPGA